jgi:DNA-binding HxlR family transcriptional regulator
MAAGSAARICPAAEEAFELLSRKWLGMIVHVLSEGEKYFCDIERALPRVSARMIATRMKDLEARGLVTRRVHTGTPVRVSYLLTATGRGLVPIMAQVAEWAQRWDKTRLRAAK